MSQGNTLRQKRNEVVQMFNDLPDNLREDLYNAVIQAPETAPVLKTPGTGAFQIFKKSITLPRSHPSWLQFNAILFDKVVLDTITPLKAKLLIVVFHRILTETLGQVPTEGSKDTAPPPVQRNEKMMQSFASTNYDLDLFLKLFPHYFQALDLAGLPIPPEISSATTTPTSLEKGLLTEGPDTEGPETGGTGTGGPGTGGKRSKRKSRKHRKSKRKTRKTKAKKH